MKIMPRWFQPQTQSQRMVFLLVLIVTIVTSWLITWEVFFQIKNQELFLQLQPLEEQLDKIGTQYRNMLAIKNSPAWQEQKITLNKQLAQLNQQLQQVIAHIVMPYHMVEILKDMLSKDPDLQLQQLKNINTVAIADPKQLLTTPLYQHNFIIQFNGNYFATLDYLSRLENLPGKLYWDSLNYQVTKFPRAEVTIYFHTLSPEQGLLNA